MTKLTKIKYFLWRPEIAEIPKFLALVGLFYSSVSPLLAVAVNNQITPAEKPALFALAEINSFSFLASQIKDSANDFFLINGSAIVGQTNPSTGAEKNDSVSPIQTKNQVVVTAYSSTPDQTDDSPFVTASGTTVRDGIVACNFLKFGTKVRLPEIYGDKIFVVEDRMAKKNSHKLDVWMESRAEALQFGVKRLTLEILD